jgi:hypothetical protein
MIRRWPERIAAAPPRDEKIINGPGNTRVVIQGGGAPAGNPAYDALQPIKNFAAQAKAVRDLVESLGAFNPTSAAPAPAPGLPAGQSRQTTLEEAILTASLNGLIAKGDDAGIDKLVDKVLGKESKPDWGEVIITKVVEAAGPKLPELVVSLVAAIAQMVTGRPAISAPAPVATLDGAPGRRLQLRAHRFNADLETGLCQACGYPDRHVVHSGLSPIQARDFSTGPALGGEPAIDGDDFIDEPHEGQEVFAVVDDLIDGLLALLIGAHLSRNIDEGALDTAVENVRRFTDEHVLFRPFVDALIQGNTATILGMAMGRRPDLAGAMNTDGLVTEAIQRLQDRLRERQA